MSESIQNWFIFCDGASRGNPGPSSTGFLIKDRSDKIIFSNGSFLGTATNNEAEYSALIESLKKAADLAVENNFISPDGTNLIDLQIFMDSELVVKQIRGIYKVKHERMKPLHKTASNLLLSFSSFKIDSIRREKNSEADFIANQVLDNL